MKSGIYVEIVCMSFQVLELNAGVNKLSMCARDKLPSKKDVLALKLHL